MNLPTPEVKRYIEQQHALAVTAILLRALGEAAPRLDHRCVVVERDERPDAVEMPSKELDKVEKCCA